MAGENQYKKGTAIYKNGKWYNSLTGLEITSPVNTSTPTLGDSTQNSESLNTTVNYDNLAGMKNSGATAYQDSKATQNYLEDSQITPSAFKGADWWKAQAEKLGYGKDKESGGLGKIFSSQNITNFGTLAKAGGDIANAYSAFQANKLLRDEMNNNNLNSRANFAANAGNYNDQAEMRNQWLVAQGRDPLYKKQATTYAS